jgi:hypothetical protein
VLNAASRRGIGDLEVRLFVQLESEPISNEAVVLDNGYVDHAARLPASGPVSDCAEFIVRTVQEFNSS